MSRPSKSLVASYIVGAGFALLVLAARTAVPDGGAAPDGTAARDGTGAPAESIRSAAAATTPSASGESLPPHGDVASLIGVSSCAASGCHGGVASSDGFALRQPDAWRSSYIIWATEDDPHRKAYRALYSPRADDIVRKLAGEAVQADKPAGWLKASEDRRCLSCHATVDLKVAATSVKVAATSVGASADAVSNDDAAKLQSPHRAPDAWLRSPHLADGIGCESCHGPAKSWVGEHFLIPEAYRTDAAVEAGEKKRLADLGMVDTGQVAMQAEACASCHVGRRNGSDIRDMNHDMIAAGHPPLYFEFAAYKAKLPRHWRLPPTPEARADLAHDAWSDGKLAAAAAQLRLSAARYEASQKDVPEAVWPEFSEYDCYACHHALRSGRDDKVTIRQETASPGPAGKQVWGSWLSWHLKQAAAVPNSPAEDWKTLVANADRPFGPPEVLKPRMAAARSLADRVEASLRKPVNGEPRAPGDYFRDLQAIAKEASERPTGWEEAVQNYLRCVASYRAWRIAAGMSTDEADDAAGRALLRLYKALNFPSDTPRPFQSPANFDPSAVAGLFGEIATAKENQP